MSKYKYKYSVLVTTYDPDEKLTEMTSKCLDLIKKNAGTDDYEILTDGEPGGGEPAMNRLFKKAEGEYLIYISNDVFINEPNFLEKMADKDAITSFDIGKFFLDGESEPNGAFYCMHREHQEKIGPVDEDFKDGYGFSDNDFFRRARNLGIKFKKVDINVEHECGGTIRVYRVELKESRTTRNHELFTKKWGM